MAALPALGISLLLLGLSEGLEYVELRLSGGRLPSEGRVEVYYDGQWGTVCDDGWDITDAHVVCRSLGYLNAIEATSGGVFGSGSGSILLDDVSCTGTETSLAHCETQGWKVHNCQHSEDAGVRCDPERLDQVFGYRLDLTAEIYQSLEELYESRRNCDMNITVTTLEDGQEQTRSCVHRLILSLHTDRNAVSRSHGNFNMQVSQDCVQHVESFIGYFYTKTINVTLSSAKCIHNMASDYGVTAIRDYCDKLFYKLLPQDPSFRRQLELYNYAEAVEDAPLKEICLQYFAWNCASFSQSPVWNDLSVEELDTLLQRWDLAIDSEFALLQAVESWIIHNSRMEVVDLLMSKIRFQMMTPEELISIPFNCSLYEQFENVFTPRLLQAFEFHAVPPQKLRYFRNMSEPSYQPRIYTSSEWSRTLSIPSSGPTPSGSPYPGSGPYRSRYYSGYSSDPPSPSTFFQTAPGMSQLYSSSKLSWSAYYHSTPQGCRNSYVICPYDTYPVAVLSAHRPPPTVTYHNQLLLLCNNRSVTYVQDLKNSSAVLPSHNTTNLFLFACDTEITALKFIVRPFYV